MVTNPKILTYFEMILDPRRCRTTHSLVEIIAIAFLFKICGAEGWEDMAIFGGSRKEWLGTLRKSRPPLVKSSAGFLAIFTQ